MWIRDSCYTVCIGETEEFAYGGIGVGLDGAGAEALFECRQHDVFCSHGGIHHAAVDFSIAGVAQGIFHVGTDYQDDGRMAAESGTCLLYTSRCV